MKNPTKWIACIMLTGSLAAAPLAMARGGSKSAPPPPMKILSIDAANNTIKVVSGRKGSVSIYTITPFTQITINDKPGKFGELKNGMLISVVGSVNGGSASRIDADDTAASAAASSAPKKK